MFDLQQFVHIIKNAIHREEVPEQIIEQWDTLMSQEGNTGDLSFTEESFQYFHPNYGTDRVYGIFDSHRFYWPIISENVDQLIGYSLEDLKNQRKFLFSLLPWEHIMFPMHHIQWLHKIIKQHGDPQNYKEFTNTIVGIKVKHKSGKIIRLQFVSRCIQLNDNNYSGYWFGSAFDISHLMKGDHYWSRISVQNEPQEIYHGTSLNHYAVEEGEILSKREMEILQLAAQGFTSKEISEKLFISTATVDTHRKNMIARLGTRDFTSLIQIARMGGILK